MKFYIKLVIFIVILFIIILLLRKKIPILREKFDNPPTPSKFDYIHNHSNSREVDDKLMNVVILTFYFKDTCPKSREFLYGCCEDFENDEINEMNEEGLYLEKNKGDTNEGKHDSYLNRIFNWFKKETPDNNIVRSDDYISVPKSDTKCLSLKNFREDGIYNNKCKLEKKPTYYYLELFANLFNQKYKEHITDTINDSFLGNIELTNGKAPKLNSIKTYLGTQYNLTDSSLDIKDINFQLRLQVKEATLDEDVGSLQIEIPRFRSVDDLERLESDLGTQDEVEKTSHKFLGNLNNFKEIMEFINDYLNISIQDKIEINKYFLKDEQRLMKNDNDEFVYEFKINLNSEQEYEISLDKEYSFKIKINVGDQEYEISLDKEYSFKIKINGVQEEENNVFNIQTTVDDELEKIKMKVFDGSVLSLEEQKIYDSIFKEVTINITFDKTTIITEESYFKLFESNPDYTTINFFSNNLVELEESYKKQVLVPIDSQTSSYLKQTSSVLTQPIFRDYIAYLYDANSSLFQEFEDLENYFSKFKPVVVSYDFDKKSRIEDVNIRYRGDKETYLMSRPRIMWNNIIDFPHKKKRIYSSNIV